MLRLHLQIEPDEARDMYNALAKCWHSSETVQELLGVLGGFIKDCDEEDDDEGPDGPVAGVPGAGDED